MRIGFIGLGTMGKNAAANIRRNGFDMVVHDIRREAMAPLVAMGVKAGKMTAGKVIEDDAGIELRVPGDWVKPWQVAAPG